MKYWYIDCLIIISLYHLLHKATQLRSMCSHYINQIFTLDKVEIASRDYLKTALFNSSKVPLYRIKPFEIRKNHKWSYPDLHT